MGIEQKVYTIADAHLDTSWVWTFETTVKEYIPATFNENFDLFAKYPEYKFNFEGSYRYELMKEYYPKAFEKVAQYVKAGKWCPCGSCYENGDVNIPSPEALIRNVIFGNGFFRDNFGVESNDIFLPDCFGFGRALPGVAAHCGLTGFSTQKLSWGCAVPIPFDIGKWTAIDGNYIWAAVKGGNYTRVYSEIRTAGHIKEKLRENHEKYDFDATFDYHGVGDRGGAPKEKSVKTVTAEMRENSRNDIKILSASTKELFDDLEAMPEEKKAKMPVYNGEFLMTEHGAGSYTTRTVSKRWNRRSELLADAAERNAVSAFILGLEEYPLNVLDTAWKTTIAHQFHDDITGTSWMIDYKRNWNDYVRAMNLFSTEYTSAVKAMTGAMNTSFAKGVAVAVSSPVQTSSVCRQAVSADLCKCKFPASARVFDSEGNEVPSQVGKSDKKGCIKVTFMASVPANGIAIYDVRPAETAFAGETGLSMRGSIIENNRYTVNINTNGDIASVFDKKVKRELLSAPVRFELINDVSYYHYSAWEVKYKDIMSEPYAYADNATYEVIDNGPVLCTLKVTQTANGSTFTKYISLDAASDFVRVYNEVDWRCESTDLKVAFPVSCNNYKAKYDIGIGYTERGTNTEKQFEVPAQRWVDLTAATGTHGVSVLSDSRTGWDKPNNNTIRLTAIHTPTYNHSDLTSQHVADMGLNRFSFGICGHEGNPDFTACAADRFCQPMHAFVVDTHKGKLPAVFSLCSVSSDTVRILGIKKAQKSDKIVIRMCEYTGKAQHGVKVKFALPIESAEEIRGDEIKLRDTEVTDGALDLSFNPFQIRSFALTLSGTESYKKNYCFIDLPWNTKASSFNEDADKACLKNGFSVPAELIPATIVEGGVGYKFRNKDNNAVICAGQKLEIPATAKSVHFILTSLNGDKDVDFTVNGEKVTVPVQDCFEAVGAWDLIGLGETGYIKKNPQFFTFTHTHSAEGDEIAKQFNLFHAEIAVSKGAEIILPDDSDIIIFAASYSRTGNTAKAADAHFDSLEKREFDYKLSAYAKKNLEASAYKKKLEDVADKVRKSKTNGLFTEKRRDKLADVIRDFRNNSYENAISLHGRKVAADRKIKK